MKTKEEIEQLLIDVYGSSISIIGKELFAKTYSDRMVASLPGTNRSAL